MVAGKWRTFDLLVPGAAPEALVRHLRGSVEDRAWLEKMFGEGWSPTVTALVLVAWLVLPLAFSVFTFERKDVVSELA